jgi:hypothetical protein
MKWRRPKASKTKGLGDAVEIVANPIAKAIDRLAGTQIQTCGGCQKRREALNRAFPFDGNLTTKP